MKKNLTFSLLLFISSINAIFSQEEFVYSVEGLKPKFLVIQSTELEQNALYTKTLNWIKKTYTNPNEVIKTTIENEMIRIEGAKKDWLCVNSIAGSVCSNALYVIEISFKKGKYKFEVISLKSVSSNGSFDINLNDGSIYYNKKGELKNFSKETPNAISKLFNDLILELNKSFSTNQENDW